MKAAILGSGSVGTALGNHLLKQRHAVAFGVRNASSDSVISALSTCKGATATSNVEAIDGADLVFVALPWEAVQTNLEPLATALVGRTVVDCTNAYEITNGCVKPTAFPSAAQVLQGIVPGAKVVKAFNQLGAAKLARPHFPAVTPWMGVAGDDAESVGIVAALAESFGLSAVPFGGLSASLLLEDMARIWIHGAYVAGLGPSIGFAMVRG